MQCLKKCTQGISYNPYYRRFCTGSPHGSPYGVRHTRLSKFWERKRLKSRNSPVGDAALYVTSLWITFFGLAYASAPAYRALCSKFGWGGAIDRNIDGKLKNLISWRESGEIELKRKNKKLLIRFDCRTGPGMDWDFEPVQSYVITRPGESTLAFFKATNMSNRPISGLSTYTILPYKAAPYFVKIQCFCFEEQRLRGNEAVDMPVLFFVEPDILNEPSLNDVEEITLSYIFYPVVDDNGPVELDDDDDPFYNDNKQIDPFLQPLTIVRPQT